MNDFPESLCCFHPDMLVEKEWALNFMEERTIFAMWARGSGAHDSLGESGLEISIKAGGKRCSRWTDPTVTVETPESKAGTLKLALEFVSSRSGNSNNRLCLALTTIHAKHSLYLWPTYWLVLVVPLRLSRREKCLCLDKICTEWAAWVSTFCDDRMRHESLGITELDGQSGKRDK